MRTPQQLFAELYRAFNARQIDAVLAALHPDVDWPNGWQGGRVHGREAVREYWIRQWKAINPSVDPIGISVEPSGEVVVDIHAVVRDLEGGILADENLRHIYQFEDGLIRSMQIQKP